MNKYDNLQTRAVDLTQFSRFVFPHQIIQYFTRGEYLTLPLSTPKPLSIGACRFTYILLDKKSIQR